nr:ABC-type transport auxiliary lipoprotein family protein [Pulveribacter suum]
MALALAATGCSILPKPPIRAAVYDFGPGPTAPQAAAARQAALAPVALADVEMVGLPEASSALLYRLAYANAQQLQPYSQARWSQPPAQLMQQALRRQLGQSRAVLSGDDGLAMLLQGKRMPTVLRVQLEEFSHVFASPEQSAGLVRVRAVVADASSAGETLLAQRVFVVQRPAATPDAAGGAAALAEAAQQAATELAAWMQELGR